MTERPPPDDLARRHLRFGIVALLLFVSLGSVLEGLHGFKVAWYLDVSEETRRLVWRLGHAHGTSLSVLHLVLGGLLAVGLPPDRGAAMQWASRLSIAGAVSIPGGFLLGGLWTHGGDPGLGVLLVPPGAVALLAGLALFGRSLWAATRGPTER